MAYYKDLREYIAALEQNGKLQRITSQINKDTELHPLVRLQFRGLPESQRKAWHFDNIVDQRGKKYAIPVVVCAMAGTQEIYALGMQCGSVAEIGDKWVQAQLHPIEPIMVAGGPCQEEVHVGTTLLEHGGLDEFPIPISTPGFDIAPYFTSGHWVTKDPETGVRNVGTYRAQVKAQDRTGMFPASPQQHINTHWKKCKERGIPLQAAIVVGCTPNLSYCSVAKIPYGVDEYAVAGGMAGEPMELVRCKTVDIEVPARAEVIIEGYLPTDEVEPEAPFGEFSGYMGQKEWMAYFKITGITHRRNPIWQAFLSQFPPSESSKIRRIAWEHNMFKVLVHDEGLKGIKEVVLHESSGSLMFCVLHLQHGEADPAAIMRGLSKAGRAIFGKILVLVDDDIDPQDLESVVWAMSYRMQPHRDVQIITRDEISGTMDGSVEAPGGAMGRDPRFQNMPQSSMMIIDATRKWVYPPVSLPRKDFMERALAIWEREGLPKLTLKRPWYGYNLGFWSEEEQEEANLAVQGRYYETGEKQVGQRKKI